MKTPCYQCQERHPVCHDNCQKYQEYHREREAICEERKRQNEKFTLGMKWSPKVCP